MANRRLLQALSLLGAFWFAASPRLPDLRPGAPKCAITQASLSALHLCESSGKKSAEGKWDPCAVAPSAFRRAVRGQDALAARVRLPRSERSRAPQTTRQSRAPPLA
ncbi:MAG: hypothetical protein KIS92_17775 [Planctomycetota bacterium]|nr:hypothetical protein [Planctomycetota bacterium]